MLVLSFGGIAAAWCYDALDPLSPDCISLCKVRNRGNQQPIHRCRPSSLSPRSRRSLQTQMSKDAESKETVTLSLTRLPFCNRETQ